jgi:cysteine-rich repeat protein
MPLESRRHDCLETQDAATVASISRRGRPLAKRTLAARAALCLAALVAFGLQREPRANAQTTTSVKTSDLKCRNHIGESVQGLVRTGLNSIDQCYEHGRGGKPCDQVAELPARFSGSGAPFTIALKRSTAITGAWCVGIQAVLNNYPGTSPPMGTVGPLVQAALDSSAASLQGPTRPTGKARRRCIDTIGRVRSKIVHQVLARAIRCQRAIDRTATSFGLISPTCLVPAQNVAVRARTIVQSCASFTGVDVGSCGPLPTCVIASATQTGHDLAVATYGFSPDQQGDLCGNGKVDPGESCDEGAANSPTGACTDECLKAACGDGKVEAGVEECDPGSQPGSTSPQTDDPNCNSDCKLTRCGDGVIQTGGNRPDEQCDDGNTVAGDGCSPTCQFETVSCPAGGTIDVTVTFVSGPDTFSSGNVAGIDISIGYPPSVGFPGSQFLPVEDPSDPASRLILLGGPYNLYDGTVVTFFDYDTAIRTVISGGQIAGNSGFLIFNFPEIPFERIRFDCVPDAPLTRAAFPCTISKMVNQIGGEVPPTAQPECKSTLPQ